MHLNYLCSLDSIYCLTDIFFEIKSNHILHIIFLCFILAALLLFVFVIHFKLKNNSNRFLLLNNELSIENRELQLKNKELLASIRYASSIQKSFFSMELDLQKLLPDSFFLFKPRDIVSGDFLWTSIKDDKLFIALADCTGHGVPGAIVSIIANAVISNAVDFVSNNSPASILNKMHEDINKFFGNKDDSLMLKEGLDIGLCYIDKNNSILKYSGAYSSLFKINNGDLIEYKGAKKSVGYAKSNFEMEFYDETINYSINDIFYLSTDGYMDQFGGPFGKKFKQLRFKSLIMKLASLPMPRQKKELDKTLNEWKSGYDQIDDISVIGFAPYK